MNKILLIFLLSLFSFCGYAQSYYFETNRTYCDFIDEDSKNKFELGVKALNYKKHWGKVADLFFDLTRKDSTFCDGYFFAGYACRLQNRFKAAVTMYYFADSLSPKPILEYKQNLATVASYEGLTELSRDKFEEIVEYFPSSPEGYYGIALTSIDLGDFEYGLKNANIALSKYNDQSTKFGHEVYLVKGIILLNLEHFNASKIELERIKGKLKRDDNFLVYYALCLKKLGDQKKDSKLIEKAHKIYNKVKDKTALSESTLAEFKN